MGVFKNGELKLKNRLRKAGEKVVDTVKADFKHATLDFIFIIVFVNVFQKVFGAENSIVGVIFTIIMGLAKARDYMGAPIKNLLKQFAVMTVMVVAACYVNALNPFIALAINLAVMFFIIYIFTYEYAGNLYFPYILSYLFLIFISPVPPSALPKRLVGVAVGSCVIMIYAVLVSFNRTGKTMGGVLDEMIDKALAHASSVLTGRALPDDSEETRADVCKISRLVYERRKRPLCISDAAFAVVDAGRGLENLIAMIDESAACAPSEERAKALNDAIFALTSFRAYLGGEIEVLPEITSAPHADGKSDDIYRMLNYVRQRLVLGACRHSRIKRRKTKQSFAVRFKAAAGYSPVRLFYALRVTALLAAFTLLVQKTGLPHGKWLLFTIASVSLPYADDVGKKALKRTLATLIGGGCSLVLFSLIPSAAGRQAIMMLSGYLSFYFAGYVGNYSMATIGALGGAVFAGGIGWSAVGATLLIRIGYILAGSVIAIVANVVIAPFTRDLAMKQLWRKYDNISRLLEHVCAMDGADAQLYYSLVIQSHMIEEKLGEDASKDKKLCVEDMLERYRAKVRAAHRRHGENPSLNYY